MYDNYYAVEYLLRQEREELEKRARFAWMLTDLKTTKAKSKTKVALQPQPSCCSAV